jgi:CheY-like chemotaxis protein/signal transduction histidine kinase
MISDRSLKIKLYITIFVVLASIAGMFLIGNIGMGILSSLRAYVEAESNYSKGSQAAAFQLARSLHQRSADHYGVFLEQLKAPLAYRTARLELEKLHPDLSVVHEAFTKGGSHREDIAGMIFVFNTFRNFEYVDKSIKLWKQADELDAELMNLGIQIQRTIITGEANPEMIREMTDKVDALYEKSSIVQNEFSDTIGETCRWAKGLLSATMLAFAVAVAFICLGGLLFIVKIINDMQIDRQKLQDNNWHRSGITALDELMQGEHDGSSLAYPVITHLCEYLGANIGAIYIAEDDDRLRLVGSYAYEKRKGLSNEFSFGEGLIGQVALEKKYILMTHCPDDYVHIQSGLGSASPKNIIAYPLVKDGVVKGVVELGLLHELPDRTIQFLDQAAEHIAIMIEVMQHRYKMAVLLERTQQQSEELQVQQEELRQTNEELEEQTRALRESEEQLRIQHGELETTNQELEERSEDLRQQKDEVIKKSQGIETAKQLLEIKAKELEVTNKYKSEFLANMSHELRTPLNSLMILSSLLMENKGKNLTEKQLEYSRTINSAGADLLTLINDILNLAKVEAGKIVLNLEDIELSRMVRDIKAKIQPMAQKKGLELKVQIAEQTPGRIISDPQLLGQILNNLLSNAIKFTAKGHVALTFRKAAKDDLRVIGIPIEEADGYLACSVEDTGIGVPADKKQLIFEAFQQADGSIQRKFGGTGLGLSISRELSRLLGGDIRLESELGKGSSFTVVIPGVGRVKKIPDSLSDAGQSPEASLISAAVLQTPATAKTGEAGEKEGIGSNTAIDAGHREPAQVRDTDEIPVTPSHDVEDILDDRRDIARGDRSILVIEDDPNFARTLMEMARERGFKALVAWEGGAALHLADFYLPSAVLLDIGLPGGMNGLTVLTKLKENLNTRHIPVHIISCYEKQREALRMGAVGFLRKPVSLDQINGVFGRIQSVIARQVKRLLVIEDNDIESSSLRELLADENAEVVTASSGEEALNAIEKDNFDCIVLDLGLPDMSGIELLEQMRLSEREPYVPVIVYTGKELTPEERAMLDKYAERVVVKDVRSPERLLDETALFLHRVENDLPEEKRRVIRMLHDREAIFDGRKLLIVDDDMRNVFALTSVLEEKGLELLVASNGQECLDMLAKTPDIHLVLMDIMMPVMDGYEAMRRIRKQKRFNNLPIITLTAKAMKGDRSACIEAGASDYLAKPVDTEKLLSMLRVWLYQ